MLSNAKKADIEFMITSVYLKPETQKYLYDFWIRIKGNKTYGGIAKPGMYENQPRITIDLIDCSIYFTGVDPRFSTSKRGKWLKQNASKYGFGMSYSKRKMKQTVFGYES